MTTTRAGDWNDSSGTTPWTALTGSGTGGVPGSGDTITVTNNLTMSQSNTVGSSPATGGTPAITLGTGGTLAITSGTLTVQGDIRHTNSNTTVTMSAGTTVKFVPAASAQYVWDFRFGRNSIGASAGENCSLIANGTSGSHCTVTADLSAVGSLAPYMFLFFNSTNMGIISATYTDFSNFGTASKFGLGVALGNAITSNVSASITNCTATACNWQSSAASGWDGNFTFTTNKFSSSVANTTIGFNVGVYFDFSSDPTSGQRTFQYNAFDLTHGGQNFRLGTTGVFADNILQGGQRWTTSGQHLTWAQANYVGNIINCAGGIVSMYASVDSNYFYSSDANNPHYLTINAGATSAITIANSIFEQTGGTPSSDTGDCVLTSGPVATQTITIQNCIVLPCAGSSCSSGVMHTLFGASTNVLLNVWHNTFVAGGTNGGFNGGAGAAFSETGNNTAGQILSWKANFVWATVAGSANAYKMWDSGHRISGGTQDVVSPTNADYNGSWNLNSSPLAGNTYTHAGNGYQFNCSATPGTHDLADQNPQFVDATRNLSAWGGTPAGGGTATNTAALAQIAANPALIRQAVTGLIPWVLAGFAPTNSALENASYPGDASTTDAAGNSWPGGGPGIGAMAFVSTAIPQYRYVIARESPHTIFIED